MFRHLRAFYTVLLLLLAATSIFAMDQHQLSDHFQYKIAAIPPAAQELMKKYTWHPGCPVALQDLAYVTLSYWGFDHKTHTGILIVNKKLAGEVVDIFRELYEQRFPIEQMETMDAFKGDDDLAMAANNTSAFNCRPNTTFPDQYSLHSYGYAIDINTLINPYVKGDVVLPPGGKAYLDRTKPVPGMIVQGDKTYEAFVKRGWTWGGTLEGRQDYQHFEKNNN